MLGEPARLDEDTARVHRRSRMEGRIRPIPTLPSGSLTALPKPARQRGLAAPDAARTNAGGAGAQHHPAGVDSAADVQPVRLNYAERHARASGSTWRLASAPTRCSCARAARPLSAAGPEPLHARGVRRDHRRATRAALVKQFTEDKWVWGERRPSLVAPAKLAAESHRHLRAGLHRGVGRDLERCRARGVSRSAATTDRLGYPRRADLAAARAAATSCDENTTLVEPAKPADGSADVRPAAKDRLTRLFKRGQGGRSALSTRRRARGDGALRADSPAGRRRAGQRAHRSGAWPDCARSSRQLSR